MKLFRCWLIGICVLLGIAAWAAPAVPNYHLIKKIAVGGDGGWDYLTIE
ncbi:MAG TPA: hypothetical protein VGM23_02870 [Armatimonadota bacterium]|jgi:hypothetical protein